MHLKTTFRKGWREIQATNYSKLFIVIAATVNQEAISRSGNH